MDALLCDELLQDIFRRLSPPSSSAVSLVSKRWLRLYRFSTTSLSLRIPSHQNSSTAIAAFLSHHPFLSSLNLISGDSSTSAAADRLLLAVSSSHPNLLRNLRFLSGPVSAYSLLSLSASSPNLTSLCIALSKPLSLRWLASFRSLKHLSLFLSAAPVAHEFDSKADGLDWSTGTLDTRLPIGWLWRSCKRLRRLRLRSCEGCWGWGVLLFLH